MEGKENISQPEKNRQGTSGTHYEDVLMREAYEKITRHEYQAAAGIFEDMLRRFSVALEDSQKSLFCSELGTLLFWIGDYEAAKNYCEKALAYGDNNDQAHMILGKIAVAQFQFPLARSHFSEISEENPARHLGLCLVAVKLRDTKYAEFCFQKAGQLIAHTDPEYGVLAAYVRLLGGNPKSAIVEVRGLLPKCEKDPLLLLLIAEIFMTAGNFGEAVAVSKKVSKVCPENDQISAILAHAAYADEDFSAADNNARDAVRLNPKNVYAKTILMKLATRAGSYAIAESIGREILDQSPEYSLGHANLGDVYFNQGRYELAELEYEQTMQFMDSNTKGARLRTARMKFIKEDYRAAAEILEKLIHSHHTYYDDAMCDLGLCYDKLGDEEKKAEVLEKMEMRKSFYKRTEKLLQELM